LVTNGEFTQGGAGWSIWGQGVTYHTNNELCLYYAQPLPNFWDAGVDQSGLPLTQGKRYRLRVQLWSQQAATIKAIVGQSQTPWTNYWNQVISLPADQVKVYSYDFTMTNATDANSGLYFHVGGHSSPVLCIDKVELIPLGGITGVVRNNSSVALPGIRVTAYGWNGSAWRAVTSVNTNSNGRYLFNSLPPAQYRLRYYDPAARYRTEFYNNVSTLAAATNIAVSAGATRNNINAVLAAVVLGASATSAGETPVPTGRVIDAQSGAPIANAVVTLYQQPLADGETSCPAQAAAEGEWLDLQNENADTAGITPRLNPQWSDSAGSFGWRLTGDGCWYVTVAAEGYAAVTTPIIQGESALQDFTVALSLAQKSYLPLAVTSQAALAVEDTEAESWSEEQTLP
jgi:5-hydroxyisourate hydrolase-like protein (transthyretin family)